MAEKVVGVIRASLVLAESVGVVTGVVVVILFGVVSMVSVWQMAVLLVVSILRSSRAKLAAEVVASFASGFWVFLLFDFSSGVFLNTKQY